MFQRQVALNMSCCSRNEKLYSVCWACENKKITRQWYRNDPSAMQGNLHLMAFTFTMFPTTNRVEQSFTDTSVCGLIQLPRRLHWDACEKFCIVLFYFSAAVCGCVYVRTKYGQNLTVTKLFVLPCWVLAFTRIRASGASLCCVHVQMKNYLFLQMPKSHQHKCSILLFWKFVHYGIIYHYNQDEMCRG